MDAAIVFSLQHNAKKDYGQIMEECLSSHDAVVIWNRGWAQIAQKYKCTGK